jgi:hypothetical protein
MPAFFAHLCVADEKTRVEKSRERTHRSHWPPPGNFRVQRAEIVWECVGHPGRARVFDRIFASGDGKSAKSRCDGAPVQSASRVEPLPNSHVRIARPAATPRNLVSTGFHR